MSSKGKKKPETAAGKSESAGTIAMSSRQATIVLGAVCFFAGGNVMVIELTGNRLLAPVFGNSLYTWTALIGVVLVAFSAGGYLGGWLVDKSPRPRVLGVLLLGAAFMVYLIPTIHAFVHRGVAGMGLVSGPLVLSLILFTIPGVLLGAVTPFTIRLLSMVTGDTRIGSAAGVIGMLGSLGSFVGTFASGFLLIPSFGVRQIFFFSGSLLVVLALLIFIRFKDRPGGGKGVMMGGFLLIAISAGLVAPTWEIPGTIFNKLTYYHEITVFDEERGLGETARYLQLDTTTEGGQIVETGEMIVGYQEYWQLAKVLGDDLERALFLGAGAFAMPQHVAKQWPESKVDVVEIDPEVIEVGNRFFRLGEYPNIESHPVDARRFLLQSDKQYDYIFGDAYNGVRNIPAHLTTKEFFETARERLSDRGVFMMNIISGLTGERSELFRAIHATVSAVFPHVEVLSTSPYNFRSPHNVILVAGNRDLAPFVSEVPAGLPPRVSQLAASRVDPSVFATSEEPRILTDDRNPVEYIVATQLQMD